MKKRMIVFFYVIFLIVHVNSLMCMEPRQNEAMVHLKLVDDNNKIYSIARWKVIQEASQLDTFNIPGITEQEISCFDKELDTINPNIIQNDKDALKKEIKKKIILRHLFPYKTTFDYLLVSMIADNIRNNRVKAEKAYSFEPESIQAFPMGHLCIPPINKLGKDSFCGKLSLCRENLPDNVITVMPLSTMMYTSSNTQNEKSCVNVCNQTQNSCEGEQIGMVFYDQKNINGLGFTTDLRHLIATFDNMLVSKAELYSDEDYAAYQTITNNIKLIDVYLLLHLYKVKKQGYCAELQNEEYNYLRDCLTTNEKGKELIKKHFLS